MGMVKYAIVENGTVINVAVSSTPLANNWIQSDTAAIGDLWGGSTFTTPEPEMPPIEEQRQAMKVSMRQARLALNQSGLLSSVEAAIASLPEPQKTTVGIEWEYAHVVDRLSPWMGDMATALGMTDEQMDDLFMLAVTL